MQQLSLYSIYHKPVLSYNLIYYLKKSSNFKRLFNPLIVMLVVRCNVFMLVFGIQQPLELLHLTLIQQLKWENMPGNMLDSLRSHTEDLLNKKLIFEYFHPVYSLLIPFSREIPSRSLYFIFTPQLVNYSIHNFVT